MNQNEIILSNFRTLVSPVGGTNTVIFVWKISLRFGGFFFEILIEHKKLVVAVKSEFEYRKKSEIEKQSNLWTLRIQRKKRNG